MMIGGYPLRAARLAVGLVFGGAGVLVSCTPSVELGAEGMGGAGAAVGEGAGGAVSCSAPAGTVEVLTSLPDVYAALEGEWQLCPPTFPAAPANAIGIEFGPGSSALTAPDGSSAGGLAYFLVQGSNGPVRGAGFAYQLTYDVSPEGGSDFQLNIHPAPNSGFGGSFRYSPSPRQFAITEDVNPFMLILAAF
jgi:hypothetical protein